MDPSNSKIKCSRCGESGHNRRTCKGPMKKNDESKGQKKKNKPKEKDAFAEAFKDIEIPPDIMERQSLYAADYAREVEENAVVPL